MGHGIGRDPARFPVEALDAEKKGIFIVDDPQLRPLGRLGSGFWKNLLKTREESGLLPDGLVQAAVQDRSIGDTDGFLGRTIGWEKGRSPAGE
jgi:hypothetical protein